MILVCGGTGFIGGRLVELLRQAGRPVDILTHDANRASRPGFRFGDLHRPETLAAALAGVDVVVQSTAFPGYPIEKPRRGYTFERYDTIGTTHLVEAARRAGARRYVYVAGVGAGPHATQPYFRAIYRGEEAVRGSGMEWAVVRPAFVYGPRDRGLNRIVGWARRTPVLPVIGLGARHQPVFVDDVAIALLRLVERGAPQRVFEIGGPERMTMRDMLESTFARAGVSSRLVAVPPVLGTAAATVLERLPGELLSRSAIDFICEDFVADNTALLADLAIHLTPFQEALARYIPGDKLLA